MLHPRDTVKKQVCNDSFTIICKKKKQLVNKIYDNLLCTVRVFCFITHT